jgi:hypothetical protein
MHQGRSTKENVMVQLPAHLQGLNRNLAENTLQHLGTASPPYLSIMGGRFTLVDTVGDEEAMTTVDPKTGIPYVDCVIIDSGPHESKIYFGQAFDPNAQSYSPPKCWSDNGVAPSMYAGEPQARSCTPDPTGQHGCKWAVWGSATSKVSGKGVPACGKYQKLALAFPDDDVVFLLRVPPNSLENLRNYYKKFVGSGVDVNHVITRISFEKDVLGTLTFMAPGQWADDKMAAFMKQVWAAKGTDTLVGRTDKPIASALPASAPVAIAGAQGDGYLPLQSQGTPSQVTPAAVLTPSSPTASPSDPAPTGRKKRGRPPANSAPAGTQAPFMPDPSPAGAGFGIQQPAAPSAELEAGLKSVFG